MEQNGTGKKTHFNTIKIYSDTGKALGTLTLLKNVLLQKLISHKENKMLLYFGIGPE